MTTNPETETAEISSEHQQILDELKMIRDQQKLSDNEFCRRYLTVSSTVWSRINSGAYPAKIESSMARLAGNLRQARLTLAINRKAMGGKRFVRLDHLGIVFDAVQHANLRSDANRLIVYLADTGGGKTMLAKQLQIEFDGFLVEARESWRKSYFAALCDLCDAAAVQNSGNSEHDAETALIAQLRVRRRVLIIDEGEYFGPRTINLLKLILNQTPTVVVLLAIPRLYQNWNLKAWKQAEQLKRRAVLNTTATAVTPSDVLAIAASRLRVDSAKHPTCIAIARAANAFGLYDLVARVIDELADQESDGSDAADTQSAIANVKAAIGIQ